MTMKSVGKAALAMVEEVRNQFNTIPGLMEGTARPDYRRCVEISTAASISEMVPPGFLVMGTPLIVGTLFGVRTLAGAACARGGGHDEHQPGPAPRGGCCCSATCTTRPGPTELLSAAALHHRVPPPAHALCLPPAPLCRRAGRRPGERRADGCLHVQHRRSLGQRQEVH
jgi:hypothetical protein